MKAGLRSNLSPAAWPFLHEKLIRVRKNTPPFSIAKLGLFAVEGPTE